MLSELYLSLYSSVSPSEKLIQQTKLNMRNKLKRNSSPAKIAPYVLIVSFSLIVISFIAVIQLMGRDNMNQNPITIAASAKGENHSISSASDNAIFKQDNSAVNAPSAPNGDNHKKVQSATGTLVFGELRSEPVLGNINLNSKDKVQWSPAQVIEYLGKDVRPSYLPDGLKPQFDYDNYKHSVFIRKDGSVYYDNITYDYLEDPHNLSSNQIKILVSKGKLPAVNVIYSDGKNTKSVSKVGNTTVSAQHFSNEYFAEFMCDYIGYYVFAKGISKEIFVKTILSIVH